MTPREIRVGDRVTASDWGGKVKVVERLEYRDTEDGPELFAVMENEDWDPATDAGWWPVAKLVVVEGAEKQR